MVRELDIILFGATGFTGKRVIPYLIKFTKSKNHQLTWGIAGRSEKKLKEVLDEVERKIGPSNDENQMEIPIIVANTDEEKSMNQMASRAKIIINCCGPYRFLGEPVVKACVEESTHYVDVTGEPQFMEKMQLKYHDKAKEKGIYVISSCGIDSIPADLGTVFLQQKFEGTINSVVTYISTEEKPEATPGPAFNYATWESAIYGLQHANELKELRRKLFQKRLPNLKPKLTVKLKPHKTNIVAGWVFPFLGADRSVMKRSQRYFYELDFKRPAQVETYFVVKDPVTVLKLELGLPLFALLTRSKCGRNLLLKYPDKLSGGLFSHEPPGDEKLEKIHFTLTLYGEGWKEKPEENVDHQHTVPPNRSICAQVTGQNPSYGSTCVCLVLAAITVITETEKMPPTGGVYPPGYAFARTTLIEQLTENDVKFEILYERDILASKY